MKQILRIIVLSLCFITSSYADDIRDFQIEGMSIGDSLLNYMSENEIKKYDKSFYHYPSSDKYKSAYLSRENFQTYKRVKISYLKDDKKYKIETLNGMILFPNNIKSCLELKNKIEKEFDTIFPIANKKSGTIKKAYDRTGKSTTTMTEYILPSEDAAIISCDDWSNEMTEKENFVDQLNVRLESKNFGYFLIYEAYK